MRQLEEDKLEESEKEMRAEEIDRITVVPFEEDNKNLDWELAVQEKQEN